MRSIPVPRSGHDSRPRRLQPAERPQLRLAQPHRVTDLVTEDLEHPGVDALEAGARARDRSAEEGDGVRGRPGDPAPMAGARHTAIQPEKRAARWRLLR